MKWSRKCIIVAGTANNQNPSFKITDAKLYVPVVTLPAQENIKLLMQLESGFKRTINWNKYQAKITNEAQNRYLDYLIDPSFQGVNKLFLFSYKDDNVMIDGRNVFDQPIKIYVKTYDNIKKLATGQGDDYKTGCLLEYPYFKKCY